MSTAENQPHGFDLVVAEDGSIPATQLHGLPPGTHLFAVPDLEEAPKRKSAMGILKGKVDVDALEEAMAWNKQQRIASVMNDESE